MNTPLPAGPPVTHPTHGCATTLIFAGLVYSALNASNYVERASKQLTPDLVSEEYDFIIAGGGTAGSVLANRLSEVKTWRILLLEAGRDEPPETLVPAWFTTVASSELGWFYRTQPEPQCCNGNPCPVYQGKTLGGGSAINGMMYVRGNALDYDEWASIGNENWSYKDVLPFFKKSENNRDEEIARDTTHHGSGGYQDVQWFPYRGANIDIFHKGLNQLGFKTMDINGEKNIGVFVTQSTGLGGERRSTNWAFLKPARLRKNLKVVTFAEVTKVLIDPETKTALGVEYIGHDGRKKNVTAAMEVILSAGAINSPKILMLSGIGPKENVESAGIENIVDLKGVGQNLQDHATAVGVEYILNATKTNVDAVGRVKDYFKYQERDLRFNRQGSLASNGMLQLTAFLKTKYQRNKLRPDIQFTFFTPLPPTGLLCNATPRLYDMAYYDRISVNPILLHPKSRGVVLLNNTDPLGSPLIYQRYFKDREDIKTLIEGLREGTRLAETQIFKEMGIVLDDTRKPGCEMYPYNDDDYWECIIKKYTWSIMHSSGTCKMGPDSDDTAVVDSRLRVKGVKKLRVVDASIMPLITGGNTNAPTIMIGERGADFIKTDHGISN